MKVLGDLTTNHTGADHPWLQAALKSKRAIERNYYYFDDSFPHGYVGWWGLASLPKLNFNSLQLRAALYSGKKSIVKKWLNAPFKLDGWRIDVGNMTGRFKEQDMQREVMRGIRHVMDQEYPDAWLVAENGDWQTEDMDGLGWQGTMNYEGFMRPLWAWIGTGEKIGRGFHGLPIEPPVFTGDQLVESMNEIKAAIPWRALTASMTMLDSHDTARLRSVVGGRLDRHLAAMTMLMTYPGVPSIFAGDELGLEGAWGEDARRTIDWCHPESWDHEFLANTKLLIKMRKASEAIAKGGLRFVAVEDDYLIYLRESKRQSIAVIVWRSGGQPTLAKSFWRDLGLALGENLFFAEGDAGSLVYTIKNDERA
jgi:alpha-glucosidase